MAETAEIKIDFIECGFLGVVLLENQEKKYTQTPDFKA